MIGYRKLKEWSEIENADQLVFAVLGAINNFDAIIRNKKIKDDWIYLLVKIFAKSCQSTTANLKIKIFATLQDSVFLKESVPNYVRQVGLQGTEEKKIQLCEYLLELTENYLRMFPSSFHSVPLDSLIVFRTKIKNSEHLQIKV